MNSDVRSGEETILLVEGNESIRGFSRVVLQSRGYTVLEAHHGSAAQRLSEVHGGPIHLLLTNVGLPDMRGRELADRLVLAHPALKVLYLNGYTSEAGV